MGRLRLAILEEDADYVSALAGFIISSYSSKLQVLAFTDVDSYKNFYESGMGLDILLVSPTMFKELSQESVQSRVLLLVDNIEDCTNSNLHVIFKFQHGDKLVGEILQASSYSEGASMVPASNTGSSKIKCLISVVISASGGVGKTSIASALCIKAASKGIKSFYLNLDSLQEPFVFESNTEQAEMSKVLYHLKEATPNALSRIEAYRSISKMSGVHHFGGFENCNEGDDVTATDIQMLFDWFKRESTYGRVIVDLPGHMNAMYLKALELCDEILLISSEDRMCELKSNRLKSFLNKYDSTKGSNLLNKLQFIRNKNTSVFEASMDKDECRDISSKTKVPFCPELILDCSERNIYRLLNNNPEFSSALSKVLEG